MQVYYWTGFGKRNNSTKQPDMQDATEANVVLKDGCSIENPVLETAQIPLNASYFHISDFGRYYFVTERVKVSNTVTRFHLATDPLATFKTAIGNYAGLISRCSDSTFYNQWLQDPLNPPSTAIDMESDFANINFIDYGGAGTYILGIVGAPPGSGAAAGPNGLARYFALTAAQITQLAINLNDQSVLAQLILEFTNPMDSIISCKWIPVDISSIPAVSERIKIGTYDTGLNGQLITQRVMSETVTIPAFDLTGADPSGYMRKAPYMNLEMFLPFVGTVPIEWDIIGQTGAASRMLIVYDVFTGDLIYNYSFGNFEQKYYGNMSTNIPISSKTYSPTGVITGSLTAAGGMASGSILGALEGISGAVHSVMTHGQVNGSLSSGLGGWFNQIKIRLFGRLPVRGSLDAASIDGLPCEKVGQISSHAGYLVMRNASLDINGTEQDRTAVNGYLNSGFFYE